MKIHVVRLYMDVLLIFPVMHGKCLVLAYSENFHL